jgi:hypothetical protein
LVVNICEMACEASRFFWAVGESPLSLLLLQETRKQHNAMGIVDRTFFICFILVRRKHDRKRISGRAGRMSIGEGECP